MTASLEGRVALVTGGGTGIGGAISARLAELGASVTIGQRTPEGVLAAIGRLRASGHAVDGIASDLAAAEGCHYLVSECVRRHGRIDILVNNAAVTGRRAVVPLLQSDDAHLDAIVDLNLKAVFRCSREAARVMVRMGAGVIVNIGSVAGHAAQFGAAAYCASKAGVLGLTRSLALELAPHGIRVICISPGDIATDTLGPDIGDLASPLTEPGTRRSTPLGRSGSTREVADCVAFVCSDAASFITGSELIVDGGWLTY